MRCVALELRASARRIPGFRPLQVSVGDGGPDERTEERGKSVLGHGLRVDRCLDIKL